MAYDIINRKITYGEGYTKIEKLFLSKKFK